MASSTPQQRQRRRFRRDGIVFAVGCVGMAIETASALWLNGPHPWLVGAFLTCMLAPAGLRVGDKTLDALRSFANADLGEDDVPRSDP